MAVFSSYSGRPPTEYLFVDGGALRSSAEAFVQAWWPGEKPEIDWQAVQSGAAKAFYYDAYPVRRADQEEEAFNAACDAHDDLMDFISSHSGWHAYAGEARHRKRRGLEQKMVDVMIAVDMLRHTFNSNMEKCTLLTSDLDFKPLLDALVQEGMTTSLWHDPKKSTRDLRRSADSLRDPLTPTQRCVVIAVLHRLEFTPVPASRKRPHATSP